MALKRRITSEDHAKLSEHLKGEYVKKGEDYFLDTEENDDAKELRAARDKEKTDRIEAQKAAKKAIEEATSLREQLDEIRNEAENGKKSEVEKLQSKHQREVEKLAKEHAEKYNTLQNQLTSVLVDDQVTKLGNELFRFTPDVLASQLIKPRLKIAEKDGKPVTVALDKDGNEMDVSALKAELLANPQYADILKPASRASGGGANHGQGGGSGNGGAKTLTEQHLESARAQGLIR